ncbi:hypothetical protein PPL_10680 [Heterostelium album PN500]|uniref:Uncharacterized protein n=1 Tax=Heterostelium pallidum (strain ATCC 26659 / Pp 5 / PN500) TaxID=670386 RepID=D3BRR9_HETP5|nr:hypothetical protein PPL_10680 [Heterostelium album PN500]EFA76101.1 hypothetical protein PPL_10680 [Heterostelium album PN500]|eukprot:XP_020428235.1 hypothetical protein PPL_10680 [Heterostelium album PN500]
MTLGVTPSDFSLAEDQNFDPKIEYVQNEISIMDLTNITPEGSGISSPREVSGEISPKLKFGKKSIGFIGGVCLLIGNMTGPGMVSIPLQYQEGGWLFNVSGLLLVEAISSIPYNSEFNVSKTIEN